MNMKNAALFSMILGLVFALSSLESCSKKSSSSTPTSNLYDTLGGTTLVADPAPPDNGPSMIQQGRLTIRDVIDSTIFVIAADDSINRYFAVLLSEVGAGNLSGFDSLSRNLTDFVSVAAGATAYTYTGLAMPVAHNPATNPRIAAAVTSGAFSEFINDVAAGATKVGASTTVIGQVAAKLEPVEPSVINQ
jgi:hypothetical protein